MIFLAKIRIKMDFFNFYFFNKDYSFAIEGIDMKYETHTLGVLME